jgi:hypothetical protein
LDEKSARKDRLGAAMEQEKPANLLVSGQAPHPAGSGPFSRDGFRYCGDGRESFGNPDGPMSGSEAGRLPQTERAGCIGRGLESGQSAAEFRLHRHRESQASQIVQSLGIVRKIEKIVAAVDRIPNE